MEATSYIFKNGHYLPWEKAQSHVMVHALHYGSGAFEGIRFYETAYGTAIFRLKAHIDRLFYSAYALGLKIPYTKDELIVICIETVAMNGITSGYIRPLIYYGYGSMRVVPEDHLPVETVVACWPWGDYLPQRPVNVAVSDFIRIHPRSTYADAKLCGHYVNSIVAGLSLKGSHYDEALLLDADGYVAEGSAENIFFVKDGIIYTTPKGTILEGVTRNSVMAIIAHLDWPLIEKRFTVDELLTADEAFFTGTAVEVSPIGSINDQLIGDGAKGPVTHRIAHEFEAIIKGQHQAFESYLTYVTHKEAKHVG